MLIIAIKWHYFRGLTCTQTVQKLQFYDDIMFKNYQKLVLKEFLSIKFNWLMIYQASKVNLLTNGHYIKQNLSSKADISKNCENFGIKTY